MERYRIRPDATVYYLTYSVVEWLPVFTTEATFRIVADSLMFCHEKKHLRINAFVIMPTHLRVARSETGHNRSCRCFFLLSD